jgi:hypothetical protein
MWAVWFLSSSTCSCSLTAHLCLCVSSCMFELKTLTAPKPE